MRLVRLAIIPFFALSPLVDAQQAKVPSPLELQKIVIGKRFVELTHAFRPGIPHCPRFPDEKRETIYWYDKGRGSMGDGFFAETFTHVGQWGTQLDLAAHFARGGRTVDQITLKEMILRWS